MDTVSSYAGVDPELAAALGELPFDLGAALGVLSNDTIGAVRDAVAQMPPPELSDRVERVDHEVPDSGGVIVRMHRPVDAVGWLPCVYWIHGGGLVLGSRLMEDLRFDKWCGELGCIGAAVEYRLAPEPPYPGPLDDCYAGLAWLYDNAEALGIDPAALRHRGKQRRRGARRGGRRACRGDRGGPRDRVPTARLSDDRRPADHAVESVARSDLATEREHVRLDGLSGRSKGDSDVSLYAAPARATDLSGLPPTLISVGAIDGFSDEDIDYAVRLRHAGVPVELHVYPGAPHGFDSLLPGTTTARRADRDMQDWLRQRLS